MSQGYSLRLRDSNNEADEGNLGVRLGRLCIAQDISVSEVASHIGVTRATVYNWFCGATAPQADTASRIDAYIATLK